jgi:hypothetical protein
MAKLLTTSYQLIDSTNANYGSTHIGYINLYAKYNTQSVADNKTYCSAKLTFELISPYTDVSTNNVQTNLVGIPKSLGSKTFYRGETLLQEEDFTINHNQDGTSTEKGCTGGFSSSAISASGVGWHVVAPKIDRYPVITKAPDFTDEDNPTIEYTTILGFVGASVETCIASGDGSVIYAGYREVVVANGSYTFNLTETERTTLRNSAMNTSSLPIRFYLRTTTANNTQYYSYLSRTLTVINANPTFNVAYQDINASTLAITNNNQQIIQNKSTLEINITNATALKGASLVSVKTEIAGYSSTIPINSATKNIAIGTINASSNTNAQITITDSRGYTTTRTLPITMLGWQLPTAIITLNRQQNFYTETDINVDANYSSLDNKNTITIKYRIKKTTDSTYGAWNNLSDNVQATFNADNTYAWNVQVYVEDKLGSNTYDNEIGVGLPIFFIDRNLRSVGVNCFPSRTTSIEINGNDISNTYSLTEEIPVGTWVDGKVIYKKTIHQTSLPNATAQTYNYSDYEITPTMLIDVRGIAYNSSNGTTFIINGARENFDAVISLRSTVSSGTKTFTIQTGQDRSGLTAYITFWYLKD